MSKDAIAKFKEAQRQGWKHFAPLEAVTTPALNQVEHQEAICQVSPAPH
jgi:hypothetical protein